MSRDFVVCKKSDIGMHNLPSEHAQTIMTTTPKPKFIPVKPKRKVVNRSFVNYKKKKSK